MASNDYHFITMWRIPGTPEEITDVLGDAPGLARWWPSVPTIRAAIPPPPGPTFPHNLRRIRGRR